MRSFAIGGTSLVLCATLLGSVFAGIAPVAEPEQTPTGEFDPRDFSGIYIRRGGNRGFGPADSNPPLTPEGEAVISARIPSPGYNRHPLVQEIDDQAFSNDPSFACNPKGFPRILLDTAHDFHEVIMLPDRILQVWQEARVMREFWLDGRALPDSETLDNLGPAWYGHSVAGWEGDTLVVNTVGLDDRAWLDQYGFPISFEARIEERYRKVDPETIELQLTLNDPKYYTRPWVSDIKIWKKEPRENVTWFGWYGLFSGLGELLCAPMNATPLNPRGG
jgi:hypothetical protein